MLCLHVNEVMCLHVYLGGRNVLVGSYVCVVFEVCEGLLSTMCERVYEKGGWSGCLEVCRVSNSTEGVGSGVFSCV